MDKSFWSIRIFITLQERIIATTFQFGSIKCTSVLKTQARGWD